jgi:hypothetical protein
MGWSSLMACMVAGNTQPAMASWVLAGMPTKTTGKENVRDGWVLKK